MSVEDLDRRIKILSQDKTEIYFILEKITDEYPLNVAPLWLAILEVLQITGYRIKILLEEICEGNYKKFIGVLAKLSKDPEYTMTVENHYKPIRVLQYLKRK